MIRQFPKNTLLSGVDEAWLTVTSYNLLAPLYVRPVDTRTGQVQPFAAFEWASDEALSWEVRRPRILAELRAARPDVICLQEVQFESRDDAATAADAAATTADTDDASSKTKTKDKIQLN